ncbi:MAG: hypothetical protein WCE87_07145 [Candidatus Udaeobacter sp.]
MTETQHEQFDADFDAFVEPGDFLYAAKNAAGKWSAAEALDQLRKFAALYIEKYSGGRSSRAAFSIVRDSMLASGDLRPLRQATSEPEQEPLTVEQYRGMPVRQIQLRYQNDPWFKGQIERLISEGKI